MFLNNNCPVFLWSHVSMYDRRSERARQVSDPHSWFDLNRMFLLVSSPTCPAQTAVNHFLRYVAPDRPAEGRAAVSLPPVSFYFLLSWVWYHAKILITCNVWNQHSAPNKHCRTWIIFPLLQYNIRFYYILHARADLSHGRWVLTAPVLPLPSAFGWLAENNISCLLKIAAKYSTFLDCLSEAKQRKSHNANTEIFFATPSTGMCCHESASSLDNSLILQKEEERIKKCLCDACLHFEQL